MANLNFNTGNTTAQTLRSSPSKYNRSKLRPNFEQSDGIRPAEVFYPHKFLPVQFQDTNTEDWVVIPKGKVCSALGVGEYIVTSDPSGALAWPHVSGSIPVYTNRSSTVVTGAKTDSYWGYEESVVSLLVPCNGGTDRNVITADAYEYSANDVTAGTYKSNSAVAADGDDVTGILCSGNIPIGAAMYDIYQDIRGKNLNYANWDKWSLLCDQFITVPFIRESSASPFDQAVSLETTVDDATAINNLRSMTWLTIPNNYVPRTGATIKADVRGNYVMQDPFDVIADIAGSTAAANPTVQTVGRLFALDTRFPKDLLNLVDTYEGSQMAGTDTGGLPYWLFYFAYTYLLAVNGSAPSIETISNYVKDGRFGMARIQLHVT